MDSRRPGSAGIRRDDWPQSTASTDATLCSFNLLSSSTVAATKPEMEPEITCSLHPWMTPPEEYDVSSSH
ncbi:predicted protein [Uncinocarpus reesii 1704]|uniref:Uncharacterized protein n=1 Tax=Uncinocarpus reesii (strain UAMH 1704) TaxID=336963 RepID=C4JXA6_UNCRE|nr:uncharacterized protein UREG_06279 [Uncinocarpus reesii 1704]EEP81414.1 predicted protein [Uncinocarpus reesii 1704]